jgi:hypothetical protein
MIIHKQGYSIFSGFGISRKRWTEKLIAKFRIVVLIVSLMLFIIVE